MRNISDKSCRENQNTILYSIRFFPEIVQLWDNVEIFVRSSRPQMTI